MSYIITIIWDITIYWLKICIFFLPSLVWSPHKGVPLDLGTTSVPWLHGSKICISFDSLLVCGGQMDRQTDRWTCCLSLKKLCCTKAEHDKNMARPFNYTVINTVCHVATFLPSLQIIWPFHLFNSCSTFDVQASRDLLYTAAVNSLYLNHSLMIAAATDACVVQEHQTDVKANRELPTELQIITIHIQPNSLKTTIHCSFTVFLSPSTRQRLCNSSFCHSFMHSVHEQNYWKSNEPISLKLGVITGPTNQKNWLTFGGAPDRLRIPDHLSIFLTIAE